MDQHQSAPRSNPVALAPILVFLALYLGSGITFEYILKIENGFYQTPAIVIFLIALAVACFQNRKLDFNAKLKVMATGVADENILTMCLVFLAAGAFSGAISAAGGADSTVYLFLTFLPSQFAVAGLFLIACFVSISMGTSVGTISALAPFAVSMSQATGFDVVICIAAVACGAMFGDNLSMISDTTIAATRTQGCEMGDKFRMNFLIVLPAALLTVALLWFSASGGTEVTLHDFELIRVLPYIAVLVLALTGLNAFIVLATGILLSGLVGLFCGIPGADGQIVPYSLLRWGQDIYKGFTGMNEIMVLSMLIGGLGELIRYHGGIAWLLARVDGLARRLAGKSGGKGSSRVGESCIALLASLADICTANNTVAIILTGGLAREIALKNGIDPRRSASLLDIFSCVFQGLIPWAAQLLLAGSLAKISPLEITINNWYCMLLAVAGILAIILGLPRIKARSTEA